MTDFLKIFQHVACGCGKVMENCECSVFFERQNQHKIQTLEDRILEVSFLIAYDKTIEPQVIIKLNKEKK